MLYIVEDARVYSCERVECTVPTGQKGARALARSVNSSFLSRPFSHIIVSRRTMGDLEKGHIMITTREIRPDDDTMIRAPFQRHSSNFIQTVSTPLQWTKGLANRGEKKTHQEPNPIELNANVSFLTILSSREKKTSSAMDSGYLNMNKHVDAIGIYRDFETRYAIAVFRLDFFVVYFISPRYLVIVAIHRHSLRSIRTASRLECKHKQ